jgi:hypothetical protein
MKSLELAVGSSWLGVGLGGGCLRRRGHVLLKLELSLWAGISIVGLGHLHRTPAQALDLAHAFVFDLGETRDELILARPPA